VRWAYLGKLGPNGLLDWGGGWSGNIPASGYVLPDIEDTRIYLKIRELAQEGAYEGRQVDWGAFAIKVNGSALLSILAECLGDLDEIDPESVLGRHVVYAELLGTEKYVALIATEL
jgi:hypothetical protein